MTVHPEIIALVAAAQDFEREACAASLEARAIEIERRVNPGEMQPHSRQLPTEEELAGASFACRQLRVAADGIRAGIHHGETDA